jgi:hypothetical protein
MATATARIPVLMTDAEKKRIVQRAKTAGISTAEYMRRAAQSFQLPEDDKMLEAMIKQMIKATEKAGQTIDDTLDFIAKSNQRIAIMEANAEKSRKTVY